MDKAINCVTTNYANFSGRASRSEFWYFVLLCFLVSLGIGFVGGLSRSEAIFNIIYYIFQLGIIIPNIAVTTRRLHDLNKSGWWQLILLIPLLGVCTY